MPRNAHYASIGELPDTIPVFPLRGCILLPKTTLPLNIFEPRYLAMIDAVIRGPRLLGIVQPDHAAPTVESPEGKAVPLRRIGGLGRLVAFREQSDGRYMITLRGVGRFAIASELDTSEPYRTCRPDYAPFAADLDARETEDGIDRKHLIETLKKFFAAKNLDVDWSGISALSSEDLVNALSVAGPYGPEEKQALIEAIDAPARAEILIALAQMEIAGAAHDASDKIQ